MPHSDALANLEIGDAAYTEFGILMVGQDEITGVAGVLASPDGINWQREASLDDGLQDDDDAAIPKALASLELLLVLIGSTYGNDSVFWYANEPSVWGVGDPKPVFDLGKEPVDVVAVEDRFIAANNNSGHGVVRTTYEGALLFASETGRTWREVASFPNAEISSLARYSQGAVAVGFDRTERAAAIWVSADGANWTQSPVTDSLKEARMDVVVTDGVTLFAFGRSLNDDTMLLWASNDATAWERIPVDFGDVLVRDAVITAKGLVVGGVDLKLNSAAFWTSPDGRAWERVPHDEALFVVR